MSRPQNSSPRRSTSAGRCAATLALLALGCACLVGCPEEPRLNPGPLSSNGAGGGNGGPRGGGGGNDGADLGFGFDAGPDMGGAPNRSLELEPTLANVEVPFGLDVSGQGAGRVGAIEVGPGGGSGLTIDGEAFDLLIYDRRPLREDGSLWFRGVAQTADELLTVWLECQDGLLSQVVWQSVRRAPLLQEQLSGSCLYQDLPQVQAADFPALQIGSLGGITQGYRVQGANIQLSGSPWDFVLIDGTRYDALVLGVLECGPQGQCTPEQQFTELPVLLLADDGQRVRLASVFLDPTAPMEVQLVEQLALPGATPVPLSVLDAQWSIGR